jgi:hypothetical protein
LKQTLSRKKREEVTKATNIYIAKQAKAELLEGKTMPNGVLTSFICTVDELDDLDTGTVLSTSRIRRKIEQHISCRANIEPILMEYCLQISKPTADPVVSFITSLIQGI